MLPPLIKRRRKSEPQKLVGTAASAVQPSAARRCSPSSARSACRTADGGWPHFGSPYYDRQGERGVTIALVALAIVAIIAMAGLSIDIGTLYQANAEAQRTADAAALAAARFISLSGITGDPANLSGQWGAVCTTATTTATTVASQNLIGGAAPTTVTVTYLASDGSSCPPPGAFGVNPMVTVKVTQANLPTYFSRIWGASGRSVSATATAEAFNPSGSDVFAGGTVVPVQPRCVKPWMVPNSDPAHPGTPFVSTADGTIQSPGINVGAGTATIGEAINLIPDCAGNPAPCGPPAGPPVNPFTGTGGNLQYLPGVPGTSAAVPSCANANPYQDAVAGCDQTTAYQCGVAYATTVTPNQVDLTENPSGPTGDTAVATQCLINESSGTTDQLNVGVYPYQIKAGTGNPLNANGNLITSSPSIVSLPIVDTSVPMVFVASKASVTIVGFLQVFVNFVNPANGYLNVTVLNVAGCGNAVPSGTPALYGSSPVPVRLVTPP